MDNEEASSSDAAESACKRQKRNNSSGESCNENDGEAAGAAAAPAATTDEVQLDMVGIGNGENKNGDEGKGDGDDTGNDDNKLESPNLPQSAEPPTAIDAAAKNADDSAVANTSSEELGDLSAAASYIMSRSNSLQETDSDADTEENEMSFRARMPTINPLRVSRRSYRSTLSAVSSSDGSGGNHNSDANSDTNDTEVEGDGDGDGTDEEAEEASALPRIEDSESRSPVNVRSLSGDSSSNSSSVAFWNNYDASSNEEPDSDDEYNYVEPSSHDKLQVETAVNNVMLKSKPSYTWNCVQELMQREHNIINRIGWRGGHTSAQSFGLGYYGSRQVVERMKLTDTMSRHRGCVNSLNFNRSGDLLCSGSDDLSVIVWDWTSGKPRHTFKSGHSLNIFQTKFLDSSGCLDIVTTSRDGQVRRAFIPPSGGTSNKPTRLYSHNDAVHKIVLVPQSRFEVMSAGEDGDVKHFDVRNTKATTMVQCSVKQRSIRLFSIAHHPYAPEFCISGSDEKLRVYDKRNLTNPVHEMTPKGLKNTNVTQITCAVYNHSGSEILATYSDAVIYLYDSRNYKDGEYLHSYEGHVNNRTIKGVNFFGPRSEYIVSGSDCGNIFYWDKNTEAVINFMKGDLSGVVNCLEPHPYMPVLATSGLENNVKVWTPTGLPESVASQNALKEILQRNFKRSIVDAGNFDISRVHYFIRQFIDPGSAGFRASFHDESVTSDSSSNSTSHDVGGPRRDNESGDEENNANGFGCGTQ